MKILKAFEDPKEINITNLKNIPLINVIVSAWKEGKTFKSCLLNIKELNYPNLKVIVNAGGSDATLKIANSFKKYENFTIIYQKQGGGKIKAINDSLDHISKGIVCILDSDVLLTDEILLKMIYPLINGKENVVTTPIIPHPSILKNDIVLFSYVNRYSEFRHKFKRYTKGFATNVCLNYHVIKSLGKFSENIIGDDGRVTGMDLSSKGYYSYKLIDHRMQSFTYPMNSKEFFHQNLRWIENSLYYSLKYRKFQILKFVCLTFFSCFILISPLILFLNVYISLIGMLIFLSMYLKKIRKILFFKSVNRDIMIKFKFIFFIKLIFFTFLDLLVNIIVFFEMIFYRKAYKKRKNLLKV
ncbi:MAG: glycosyltransferase [Promethearchaeota archaeon]